MLSRAGRSWGGFWLSVTVFFMAAPSALAASADLTTSLRVVSTEGDQQVVRITLTNLGPATADSTPYGPGGYFAVQYVPPYQGAQIVSESPPCRPSQYAIGGRQCTATRSLAPGGSISADVRIRILQRSVLVANYESVTSYPEFQDPKNSNNASSLQLEPLTGYAAGLVCGKAKFNVYAINTTSGGKAIKKGNYGCLLAASNASTREVLAGASSLSAGLVSQFGRQIAVELGPRALRGAARAELKRQGKNLLFRLLGATGSTLRRMNGIVTAGKAAGLLAIPYGVAKHVKHVTKYNACTRLYLQGRKKKLRASGGILYSPSGLNNPRRDAYLTRVKAYEKKDRRLRPDKWIRRESSLACNESGRVTFGSVKADRKIFKKPRRIAITFP